MALDASELLAAYDNVFRARSGATPRLGITIERFGSLILTHYGTHCTVEDSASGTDDATSAADLVEQVKGCAAERVEPVEWRVFTHDAAAPYLAAALEAAGFAAGWERSVLVGEVAELDFPEPTPDGKVTSLRWEEPEVQEALDLSSRSGPHRTPLAAWYALRSTAYWDVDVRVLSHRGRVAAACWLENIRNTAFAAIGGLTAPRTELLAQLPMWRFQPLTKQYLVAEADGELRSALLAAGFNAITTVRSGYWNPPGSPAATPPARQSLYDSEYTQIARRCEARISFEYASGSGRYVAPIDSRSWFYGMLDGHDDPTVAAVERVIERGLRACVRPGEWVYQYRPYLCCWEFEPHRVGLPGQPRWPGSAVPDGEFHFLATSDARVGIFGHYFEQTLVVFGDSLVREVADDLDRLLGDGTWTFG